MNLGITATQTGNGQDQYNVCLISDVQRVADHEGEDDGAEVAHGEAIVLSGIAFLVFVAARDGEEGEGGGGGDGEGFGDLPQFDDEPETGGKQDHPRCVVVHEVQQDDYLEEGVDHQCPCGEANHRLEGGEEGDVKVS